MRGKLFSALVSLPAFLCVLVALLAMAIIMSGHNVVSEKETSSNIMACPEKLQQIFVIRSVIGEGNSMTIEDSTQWYKEHPLATIYQVGAGENDNLVDLGHQIGRDETACQKK